tara:strand:+ start:118 stop:975 length:858 start_codon:yes stop_codon:yes gene_type:complete
MKNYLHHSLKDKVVLITGGSRGFGWFIAERLLKSKSKVAITASSGNQELNKAKYKAKEISKPDNCLPIIADVRDWEDCKITINKVIDQFGRIDVLINNAGKGSREYRIDYLDKNKTTKFWDIPTESWNSIIDTNLTGSFQMTKAVVPQMIKQKFGKIFSISTSLTTMIGTGLSPYGASKAGLELSHITWARELLEHKIDINILLPGGASDTDFIPASMVPGKVGERQNKILPGNVIVPPAIWLCSDETNGITGRRIIAKFWDHNLPAKKSFEKCLQPQNDHPEIM